MTQRQQNLLTVTKIKSSPEQKLRDGNGLWLHTGRNGSRHWVFIFIRDGKRREMGLGGYGSNGHQVSLAEARDKADQIRSILKRGGDPFLELPERQALAKRRAEVFAKTFGEVADEYIETNKRSWRGAKTEAGWRNTLTVHAAPLRGVPVAEISTAQIVQCLQGLWSTKPETAGKLRVRVKQVLDFAKALGLRTGDNPAEWQGHLKQILKPVARLVKHHAALPHPEIPALLTTLRQSSGYGALALRFCVLTAARSGEVRGARWQEIDIENRIWTIPAERMKAHREHRIPLSQAACGILEEASRNRVSDLVFPSSKFDKPLSDMTLAKALKTAGFGEFTVHGFRSSFRDWVSDFTDFTPDIAEAALAHSAGDKVVQSYRRGDAFLKRAELMDLWALACETN